MKFYRPHILPLGRLQEKTTAAALAPESYAVVAFSSYPERLSAAAGGHLHFLALPVDDIPTRTGNYFQEKHAASIRDFLLSLPGEVGSLFFCCDSGESRSSACAAAVLRAMGVSDAVVWENPKYHPNRLVYAETCRAFGIPVTEQEIAAREAANEEAFRRAVIRH